MSQEIIKFEENNTISLENSSHVKEEFQDVYYPDNKVWLSETTITDTINISNNELNGYIRNDKIKYEMLSVEHIKIDLPELPTCNHCHEVYQDYCTKCRVLMHILNKRPSHSTYNRVKELPTYMLEARESYEYLGIFSLKVIPDDVTFGPFTGLNSTELPLRITGGRFVINDDQSKHLNWMQYINRARNIDEQNLLPFQYEGKLYYCSTRKIQEGEELLVYFGEKYQNSLLENIEIDFVPIKKEDIENVFACTFCCLGFRSKEYLAEHKAVFHHETNEMFSVEELVQCPFCKFYLEAKEYFEHHMDYCCETNDRHWVLPLREVHKQDVGMRSSLRSKTKRRKRRKYKCTQCKFRTMYNADFRHHTNSHYKVKMYKCEICHRRYKTKESLKIHVKKNHADNDGSDVQKYSTYDTFKLNIENTKDRSTHTHHGEKQCQPSKSKIQTRHKCHSKPIIKIKHLNTGEYKCENCEFITHYKPYFLKHMKMKHFMESKHLRLHVYKCMECEYQTNWKSNLKAHVKTKHLTLRDYKCMECEYQTNLKSNLGLHIKSKHLNLHDYKCVECEYQTNIKTNLERHIKSKHLKLHDYKCTACEYQTNLKSNLKVHVKTKHLKLRDYKCIECEYQTNLKSNLERHIRSKHLKLHDYKCMDCEYQTNWKSVLQRHMKTKHLKLWDYQCMDCEFQTNTKSHLERHMKEKHLKLRDYKCLECEYKANRKSSLELHVKTKHLKLHDFKCTECEYQTNWKSVFKRHMKTKHLILWDYQCIDSDFQTNSK